MTGGRVPDDGGGGLALLAGRHEPSARRDRQARNPPRVAGEENLRVGCLRAERTRTRMFQEVAKCWLYVRSSSKDETWNLRGLTGLTVRGTPPCWHIFGIDLARLVLKITF